LKDLNYVTNGKRNMTLIYSLVQCLYWTGFAILGAFASLFLLSVGLGNTAIGVVLAIGALAAALLQPVVGSFVDASRTIFNRHVMIFIGGAMTVVSFIIWVTPATLSIPVSILFAVNYVMLQMSMPFVNAMGMDYMNAGYELNFGVARAVGSFGYAIVAYVMGILTVVLGPKSVPLAASIVFACLLCVVAFLTPAVVSAGVESAGNEADLPQGRTLQHVASEEAGAPEDSAFAEAGAPEDTAETPIGFLKKYPVFGIMLTGLVCIYYTHTLINTYALQILVTKGGDGSSVGLAAAIAAGLEVITMLLFPIIQKYFRIVTLIRVACAFFTLKVLFSLLAPNVPAYMAVQILQMFGWGILAIAIVYYVNEVIDRANASQGQAYAGMSMTMGTVVASLVCGRLLDTIGVNSTLVVGVAVGVVGTVIVVLTTTDRKSGR